MIAATIMTGAPKIVVKMIPTIGIAMSAPKSSMSPSSCERSRSRSRFAVVAVIVADADMQAFLYLPFDPALEIVSRR